MADIIQFGRYQYGECACGNTQFHILLDPVAVSRHITKAIGLQCSECHVIAMFDEGDEVEFESE